jgi:hypothetical protein
MLLKNLQVHQMDVPQLGLVHASRTTQFRHDKMAQAGAAPKYKRADLFNKYRSCGLPEQRNRPFTAHWTLVLAGPTGLEIVNKIQNCTH